MPLLNYIRIVRTHLVIGKWRDGLCLQLPKAVTTKEKLMSLYIFLHHKYTFQAFDFKLVYF